MTTPAYTDALERALGSVIAGARREMAVVVAQAETDVALLRAQLADAKADAAALEARLMDVLSAKVSALPAPEPVDLSGLVTEKQMAEALAGLPEPTQVPDLSGFATKGDVAEAVASIPRPEPIDLSALATLEALADVRAAIPTLPEPIDLSGLATKADVEAVREAIPVVEAPDLTWLATKSEVAEAFAALPEPTEPPDLSGFATREEVETVRAAIPALPEPRDWTDDIEAVANTVGALADDLARVEVIAKAHPGTFPQARAWAEDIHEQGTLVTYDGALWQAAERTFREPPHADWTCVVAKGEPGLPGASITVRGTYDPAATYGLLDVVALDGSSFIAKRDEPGPCPGEGWQLHASRGGRGKQGESIKGDIGPETPTPVGFRAEGESALVITLSDGTELTADLYPILRRVLP